MLLIESLIESTKATFYQMPLWTYFYFGSVGMLWALICRKKTEGACVVDEKYSNVA